MQLASWGRLATCLLLAAAMARAEGPATPLPPVQVPPAPAEGLQAREASSAVTVLDLTGAVDGSRDAAQVLRAVPGAVIVDSGGAGQRKTLSLRGAAPSAVLVLLDGVPLASPGEATDLSRIPTAALSRLEVLRGAGSRYGPGAMGGVVNLVTREVEGTRAFGELVAGSFLTARGVVGGSFPVPGGEALLLVHGLTTEGRFDYRYQPLTITGDEASALTLPRENNAALQGGALARYRARLGDTTLDVLAEGLAERRGLAGPAQNPTPLATQRTTRGSLSVRSSTPLPEGGTLAVLAWGRLDDALFSGSPFVEGAGAQRRTGTGVEATYTQTLGRHALTALATGGGDWLSGATAAPAAWGRVGAMLSDELSFWDGRLTVDGSARLDLAGPFVVVSPRVGATAQLPWGFELRASAGQASRAPSFSELYVPSGTLLPNPGLRPERALGADLAVGWRRGVLSFTATGFGTLYQDLISYEYYPPSLARPYNFEAARVAGVELEAHARPLPWLELSAAYTFSSSANLKEDPRWYGKALPMRPEHQLHARAAGGTDRVQGTVELTYQSAVALNRTGTLGLPGRALLDAGLSLAPFEEAAFTVSFDLKNLLDVRSQDLDGYPLPPRSAFLTLGLAWDGVRHP